MMIQKKRKKNKLKKVNKKIKKKENIFKRTNSISSGSDQDMKETNVDFDKMKSKNPNGKFLINEKFGNEDGQRVIQEVISNFLDSEAKPAIENI